MVFNVFSDYDIKPNNVIICIKLNCRPPMCHYWSWFCKCKNSHVFKVSILRDNHVKSCHLSFQVQIWGCRVTHHICFHRWRCSTRGNQSNNPTVCTSEQHIYIQCNETDFADCRTVINLWIYVMMWEVLRTKLQIHQSSVYFFRNYVEDVVNNFVGATTRDPLLL